MSFKDLVKERVKELETELESLRRRYPDGGYNRKLRNCQDAYNHNRQILFLIEQYEKYGIPKVKIGKGKTEII